MKKQIKKCKGFENANCCIVCKRLDRNAELLVKSLSVDPDDGRKYCNLLIYK